MLVTTSWDDGHPLDFRVAELLDKYGIKGTFYIPKRAERPTITSDEMRSLGESFEIGAHTLSHVDLTKVNLARAKHEISGSKGWIESVLGRPCTMFCFPRGKFSPDHVNVVREAGFIAARTVELLSVSPGSLERGIRLMPTTVQVYGHSPVSYAVNTLRRGEYSNLWWYIVHGRRLNWDKLAARLSEKSLAEQGVFHLWGHSWEIEEYDQWNRLESVLSFLSQTVDPSAFRTNGEICQALKEGLTESRSYESGETRRSE